MAPSTPSYYPAVGDSDASENYPNVRDDSVQVSEHHMQPSPTTNSFNTSDIVNDQQTQTSELYSTPTTTANPHSSINNHVDKHITTASNVKSSSSFKQPQTLNLEQNQQEQDPSPKAYLTHRLVPTTTSTTTLLLLLALATGINDASTFIDYHLFVSNQTGNTVFLGIGTFLPDPIFDLRHVGLSLGGFLLGGLLSGQIGNHITGKRTRYWIVLTSLIQTLMTLTAAALRQWYAVIDGNGPNHGGPRDYAVILLLAVASGAQVAMARGLGLIEIPTGMITSAWIDLVVDPRLWTFWEGKNRARDRRLAFICCILVGGFVGAAANVYCAPALPLLLAGIVKAVVTVGFLLGRPEDEEKDEKKTSC